MKAVMNPQLFLSGFKNGPVHTWRTKIELAHPHVSDGIRIHSGDARLTRCAAAHIGYCSPRLDTFFSTSPDSKESGFTCTVYTLSDLLRIFFSTLESGLQNIRIRCWVGVDVCRIRKNKISELKNIRIRVDAALQSSVVHNSIEVFILFFTCNICFKSIYPCSIGFGFLSKIFKKLHTAGLPPNN